MKAKLKKLTAFVHFKNVIELIIDKLESDEIDSAIFEMTMPELKKAYENAEIARTVSKNPAQIYSKKCDELYKLLQQKKELANDISNMFLEENELVSSLAALEICDAIIEELQIKSANVGKIQFNVYQSRN